MKWYWYVLIAIGVLLGLRFVYFLVQVFQDIRSSERAFDRHREQVRKSLEKGVKRK